MKSSIGDTLYVKGRIGWKGLKKTEYLKHGTYRIINGSNILDSKISWDKCGYISKERYEESPEIQLRKDDILVTKDGTIGKTAMVGELSKPTSIASGLFLLRNTLPEKWNSRYLFYFLQSKSFSNFIKSRQEGSVIPHLYQKDFEQLELPDISKEEQNRIVYILDTLTDKIENNNDINANLAELAQSVYQRILSTFPTTEVKLNSFATITMGQSPSSKTYNENKIGMPLLNGAADFRDGIHPSKWTTDPKRIAKKGSYIFGVRATIGLTTKIFHPYAIGRGTGTATPKDINNDEILYFVLNDMFKKFEQTGSGSVYINISKKDFQNYTFNIPDTKGLLLFHKNVQPIMDQVYKRKQENETLQKIKDCLLNKLF